MKAHQGDIVDLRAPAGVDQIEVLAIRYGVADSKQVSESLKHTLLVRVR